LMDIDAVNYRGLARYLKDSVEEKTGREDVNLDSIVVAIRRYEDDLQYSEFHSEQIREVLRKSEITMKSNIIYYTFPREKKYQDLVLETYDKIDRLSGDRIYFFQSDAEIGIVVNENNSELIEQKIKRREAKNIEKNLSILVMDSPEEILESHGFLNYLLQQITLKGVGIIEMFATYTETVFLVKEENATTAYSVLRELIEGGHKS
ncbi:MAG: hypothetical protein ABEJ56_03050, partial [Candidatus Nanohaloarchaea archaeon]